MTEESKPAVFKTRQETHRQYGLNLHGLIGLMIAIWLAGCASTPEPTAEWRNPEFAGKLTNILVISVTSRSTRQRMIEDLFVTALSDHGLGTTTGYSLITLSRALSRDTLQTAIRQGNIDGIIIARIAAIDKNAGEERLLRRAAHRNFYDDYEHALQETGAGYAPSLGAAVLEISLYNAGSQQLIWSLQSDVLDPQQPRHQIEEWVRRSIKHLHQHALI